MKVDERIKIPKPNNWPRRFTSKVPSFKNAKDQQQEEYKKLLDDQIDFVQALRLYGIKEKEPAMSTANSLQEGKKSLSRLSTTEDRMRRKRSQNGFGLWMNSKAVDGTVHGERNAQGGTTSALP